MSETEIKDLESKLKEMKKSDKKETKKKKEDKKWWEKMFHKDKLKKSNRVAVLYLRHSGNAEALELEPKKGFFNIDGKVYHERRDCTYTITKDRLPLAIIREGELLPEGTDEWKEKTLQQKFFELQDHVLRGIRHAELVRSGERETNQIDMKKAIGFGILAIVVAAVIMNFI